MKTHKGATAAVTRNLHKWRKDAFGVAVWRNGEAWERLDLTSVETFTRDAKAYLSDKSELRHSTLTRADWQAVYDHFNS